MTTFEDLQLIEPLVRAVAAENYEQPTPIQAQAIPLLLAGRDVLGCAQTGTGKTAAFALPVLQRIAASLAIETAQAPVVPKPAAGDKSSPAESSRRDREPRRHRREPLVQHPIRALVLSPTRELAAQIGEHFRVYGRYLRVRHTVIFGGVSQGSQELALRRGIDVLVATPGRLLDLQRQGLVDLSHVEFFVLDEADRMLDMGFIHDIRTVIALLPKKRQNLLFSATMPESIVELASGFLHDPARVEVTPQSSTVEQIEQCVMFVQKSDKQRLLEHLVREREVTQAIVFTRTKHGANRVATHLGRSGIRAEAIHGNKSQNARTRALDGFRRGEVPILVATDIASRGIDVDGVSHVFNFDLPNEPEVYVHRIGRTGRAGRSGIAVAFCDDSEGDFLRDIEKLTGVAIDVAENQPWHFAAAIPPPESERRAAWSRSAARGRPSSDRRTPPVVTRRQRTRVEPHSEGIVVEALHRAVKEPASRHEAGRPSEEGRATDAGRRPRGGGRGRGRDRSMSAPSENLGNRQRPSRQRSFPDGAREPMSAGGEPNGNRALRPPVDVDGNRAPRAEQEIDGNRAPRSQGAGGGNRAPRSQGAGGGNRERGPRAEGGGNREPRQRGAAGSGERRPRGEGNGNRAPQAQSDDVGNRAPRGERPAATWDAPRGETNSDLRPGRRRRYLS